MSAGGKWAFPFRPVGTPEQEAIYLFDKVVESGYAVRKRSRSAARVGAEGMCSSILPIFMADGKAVELVAVVVPVGHEAIEEGDEVGVVGGFEQV